MVALRFLGGPMGLVYRGPGLLLRAGEACSVEAETAEAIAATHPGCFEVEKPKRRRTATKAKTGKAATKARTGTTPEG